MDSNEEYLYRMNRAALFGIQYDAPIGIRYERQEGGIPCFYECNLINMEKLNCYICDKCRKVLWHKGCEKPDDVIIDNIGNRELHYCKEHKRKKSGFKGDDAVARQVYTDYRLRCKHKNLEFSITFDEFLEMTKRPCVYCGEKESLLREKKHMVGKYKYNSLDRIDNNVGYIPENVQPCCDMCNQMKSHFSEESFLQKCKQINVYGNKRENK